MFSSLYKKKFLPYLVITLATIISTVILWLPFILRLPSINNISIPNSNFEIVLKHWDGPLYIIPAKTFYDINNPILKGAPLGLNPKYFAAHLPGYPLTIRALSFFVGFPKATVLSTLIFSIGLYCFFYYFVKKYELTKYPLALTAVFLFFTPRLLVVRSVGTPEPMFLLFILASLYFFIEKRFFWAGVMGGLAVVTKTPGILLFVSYSLLVISYWAKERRFNIQWLWIALIPIALLTVFAFYGKQYGDFFAYFHSGDNLHLVFPPFSVFNYQKLWVGTAWLEEIIFIYFFYLLALLKLYETPRGWLDRLPRSVLFLVMLPFFLATISIQHRDIARYSLPMLSLALITFEEFFTSKKFLIALIILLPAIYLNAWNFMLVNIAPITDWAPFL